MSKIITIKLLVRDSHNPDERVYEETRRFDGLSLPEELQLAYAAMGILGPKLAEPAKPMKPRQQPLPLHSESWPQPRNRHGNAHYWESNDGRTTFVCDLNPKHARNIIKDLHRKAVKAGALHISQWCRQNYPQYDGILERAGVPTVNM